MEDALADCLARRAVEKSLEEKVAAKLQEQQERYLEEIKLQILKRETGVENAVTLKKYALLEKKERVSLSVSAQEALQPSLDELVGQEGAVRALLAKLASPYPQHVLLYGPEGGQDHSRPPGPGRGEEKEYTFSFMPPLWKSMGLPCAGDPGRSANPSWVLSTIPSTRGPPGSGRRGRAGTQTGPGHRSPRWGSLYRRDREMDFMLQNKLLKVLEDKRVCFDSSITTPRPRVPKYIKKLFAEGAPADFILIGATTRDPAEINPAIRSRCAEVFFSPLTRTEIKKIVVEGAKRIGARLSNPAAELISACTIDARQAINVLADAFGLALSQQGQRGDKPPYIGKKQAAEVLQLRRLSPQRGKASERPELGKAFGLGVNRFLGQVLEVEAAAFSAREKGQGRIRFNDTAGSMARDSVFNAAAVIRKVRGIEIADYDLHVNLIGGGQVDGPSAGAAIFLALVSAIEGRPLRQDVAVSGEISIQGRLKAVGGIPEKIYGARQAGMKQVLLPRENRDDVPRENTGIQVILVDTVAEMLEHVWAVDR